MTENPYRPPTANVRDAPASAVLPSPRTPVAVVLVQVVVLLAAVMLAVGSARIAYRLIGNEPSESVLRLVLATLWRLAASISLAMVVLQIRRRTRTGRILGLGVIALVMLGTAIGLIDGRPVAVTVGSLIGFGGVSLTFLAILLWWAHAFGFSRSARGYFHASGKEIMQYSSIA